jgi:hypothetical protein
MSQADRDVLATPEHPAVSPSGHYVLEVLREGSMSNTGQGTLMIANFRISQVGGKVVYEDDTDYDLRHTTFFLWGDHADQAWVYSGDIGTSYVDLDKTTGKWAKHDFFPDRAADPPTFLKRARGIK